MVPLRVRLLLELFNPLPIRGLRVGFSSPHVTPFKRFRPENKTTDQNPVSISVQLHGGCVNSSECSPQKGVEVQAEASPKELRRQRDVTRGRINSMSSGIWNSSRNDSKYLEMTPVVK
ncbi:hypothetical protein TIFTF001_021872 [Ficus carica]|uniref:Uncharacterized protein n=1 Tax=Ficus carica TaxID=3494 RepID=A0AA88AV89_FICCA|nr:hypothetical protein TIFTF001_021872 [Ficus carica]